MTRGRKPEAGAQRRGGANDKALAMVAAQPLSADSQPIVAPEAIAAFPHRMEMWASVVGDGSAYRPEDVPLLSSLVVWMDTADQIMGAMTNEDGGILLERDGKPSNYLKQLDLATKNILKLSDQLGCTPLARARLGLTQAAATDMAMTIQERIDRSIARKARK